MRNKILLWLVALILLAVVGVLGYQTWQTKQRDKAQVDLIKTANNSYPDDARYISFGMNYLFAIPKSFAVDESAIAGVQLVIPGSSSLKANTLDQLYDAAVVAVQPATQVKPNDSKGLKTYIEQTLLPDLKKNLSSDITTTYSYSGKYPSATVIIKKDGKQVRQMFLSDALHPFLVVAKERSDAYLEVSTSMVDLADFNAKDDIALIKSTVQNDITLLQQGKAQELFDGASSDFKQKTSVKDLASASTNSSSYLNRNIVVFGGSLLKDQFSAQLSFTANKGEQPTTGLINLRKEGGAWKILGFQLPQNPK